MKEKFPNLEFVSLLHMIPTHIKDKGIQDKGFDLEREAYKQMEEGPITYVVNAMGEEIP